MAQTPLLYSHEPAGARKERWLRARLAQEVARTDVADLHILDVGCGMGHLSMSMAQEGYHVWAIDSDPLTIAMAEGLYGGSSVQFGVGTIAAQTRAFNVITAFEVCEHISSLPDFLEEVKKHLVPGGLFLISVPNGWSAEELARRFAQHTAAGKWLKSLVRASGVLPKTNAQSAADSPHVQFNSFSAWHDVFTSAGFSLEDAANVSLTFKQFFYLGARRFIEPESDMFKFLDALDGILVRDLPLCLADGWVMAWRRP